MAARRPARRRGDGIAVLRPLAVPSGTSALSLLPLLADALAWRRGGATGASRRRAPNFASDNVVARRRADRRRRRGRGFHVGYHGCAQGRDAHRVGVDGQRRSHAPPAGRPRAVAACAARLSRRRAAGAGAQRCRGYDAGRGVCRVRRGRIGFRCSVTGVGPAVCVAGGGAAGQGSAGSGGRSGARIAGRGADRRRADAARGRRKSFGSKDFGGADVRDERDGGRLRLRRRSAGRSAGAGRRSATSNDGRVVLGGATLAKGYRNAVRAGSVRGAGLVSHRRHWRR